LSLNYGKMPGYSLSELTLAKMAPKGQSGETVDTLPTAIHLEFNCGQTKGSV